MNGTGGIHSRGVNGREKSFSISIFDDLNRAVNSKDEGVYTDSLVNKASMKSWNKESKDYKRSLFLS